MNVGADYSPKTNQFRGFLSYWHHADPPNTKNPKSTVTSTTTPHFLTASEADIANLSPASLLTFHQGFHRANFLPKPTPEEQFYASHIKQEIPTWQFTIGADFTSGEYLSLRDNAPDFSENSPNSSKNGTNPSQQSSSSPILATNQITYDRTPYHISTINFHYKSHNFFVKGAASSHQINAAAGFELWRGASIANGIIYWKLNLDSYAHLASESFWQSLQDIQHWTSVIKLTNPGARFIDLYDQNGKVIRRIDLLQSLPGKPAFVKNFAPMVQNTHYYDPDGYHKNEARSDDRRLHNNAKHSNSHLTTDNHLTIFSNPLNNDSNKIKNINRNRSGNRDDDNDDDDDDDDYYYYDGSDDDNDAKYETQAVLHQPLLPTEVKLQAKLQDNPQISLFTPLFSFLQDSIRKIDLSTYSDEQLHGYLNEIHNLRTTLPRTMQEELANSEIYSQLYDLVQRLPIPELPPDDDSPTGCFHNPHNLYQPHSSNTNPKTNPKTNPNTQIMEQQQVPQALTQIVNNGDPFDMSNVSDKDILRLTRSDTPYVFQPDPYYISSHSVLLNTARLLQLPALFKYLNAYLGIHYSYVPDSTMAQYKPSSIESKHDKKRKKSSNSNQNPQNGPIDFEYGEHRVALSCHVASHNDRFHALVVSNSTDDIYTARVAFTLTEPQAHVDHFSPEHPLSPHYRNLNKTKHPAQQILIPDVYYATEDEHAYYRTNYLPCAQHIIGLQGLLYPSGLTQGYNPSSWFGSSGGLRPDGTYDNRPTFEEFREQTKKSPLSIVSKFSPQFRNWMRRRNIALGLEFQYAYIRPIRFDLWGLMYGVADQCDSVVDMLLTKRDYDNTVIASTTGTTTPILTTLNLDLPPGLQPPPFESPLPIGGMLHDDADDSMNQNNSVPRRVTLFKELLTTVHSASTKTYHKFLNFLPTFSSRLPSPISTPSSIVPNLTDATSGLNLPTSQPIDTTPLHNLESAKVSPPPNIQQQQVHNPTHLSLATLYQIWAPVPYQSTMVCGVNMNINGVVQGYSTVDVTNTTTLSFAVQGDLSTQSTGAVRPLLGSSPFSYGIGISYHSR